MMETNIAFVVIETTYLENHPTETPKKKEEECLMKKKNGISHTHSLSPKRRSEDEKRDAETHHTFLSRK